jgi:cobalt/nickel transport system permease protein
MMSKLPGGGVLPAYPEPSALHIPDGFVSAPVAVAGYAISVVFIAIAVRKASDRAGEKAAPLMGVLAAFIFAAQMINFPVAGGTSGHLLGGALAAILLGPWAAILVMTAVVSVQALIFQDGGLAALGVNVFNMGIVTALLGYAIFMGFNAFAGVKPSVRLAGAFVAGWTTVMVAAALTAFELSISDTSALEVALPSMLGVHALIGIGEGLITAAAIAFVQSTRPDLIEAPQPAPSGRMSEAQS